MKKNLFIVFAVTIIFSFSACKKSEDTCTLSAASLIGTYKLTSIKINGVDFFSLSEECGKDDTYTFNANGTTVLTDAGVVCSPSNNDTSTWSLSGNSLTIDGDVGTVSNFSCNGFTITTVDAGQTYEASYVR